VVLVFFRLTEMVLADMRNRGWGRILNVASESVVQPIPHIAISNTLRGAVVAGENAGGESRARESR